MENDICRIPKSHNVESISDNVLLLPYWKPNIPNQLQYTVVADFHTVLTLNASVGNPEYCRNLFN